MKRIDFGTNYVRYALGNLEVVSLCDGYVDMPASRLRQPGNKTFGPELPPQVTLVDGSIRLSVNAFLVIDGSQTILIDTGAADSWKPSMGGLLSALDEAKVGRDSIETVALTHTHEDHAHGLVAAGGTDAFPNLKRLFVPVNEIGLFDAIDRVKRFRDLRTPISDGDKLSPNITALRAHGHEIGHTAYQVSSADETLLIWGDIVHVPSIQFERPELTWEFDADQDQARSARSEMLKRAARPNVYVAGAHLVSPGVGHVRAQGDGYEFKPI